MMKKFFRFCTLVFCVMLVFVSACAEGGDTASRLEYEKALLAAIAHWDELEQQYDELLTNQQRFVARYKFTDAIQFAREGNYAMINAINACASLEDFVAILNGGVIDPNNPCVPEDKIIEQIHAVMKAAGYDLPECIFAIHHYSDARGHYWYVECGTIGLRTYENGDEFIEPIIEHKMMLEGENHCVTMFADTDIIDDDVIRIRYF